jgi:tetratricopeptide (TPR) repeat protein
MQPSVWRDALSDGSAVLLVGAGISADPPASLPLAAGLSIEMVRNIARRCALNPELLVRVEAAAATLRPEVLADILLRHVGGYGLKSIYSALDAHPNDWHSLLATSMARGCTVITTNFDILIERSCADQNVSYQRYLPHKKASISPANFAQCRSCLIKLHGSLPVSNDANKLSLAFALKHVSRGIPSHLQELLQSLLADRPLIVLGYAGRDDFDIRPFLLNLNRKGPTLWVIHDSSASESEWKPGDVWPDAEPAIELYHQWAGSISIVRGPTQALQRLFPTSLSSQSSQIAGRPAVGVSFRPIPTIHRCLRSLVYVALQARAFRLAHELVDEARMSTRPKSREEAWVFVDEAVVREKAGSGLHAAARAARQAIRAGRRLGIPRLLAHALDQYGVIARRKGHYAVAESRYARALTVTRSGRRWRELEILIRAHRAIALEYLERYSEAINEYEHVLRYERRSGDLRGAAMTISNLAIVYSSMGAFADAESLFHESIELKTRLGDPAGVAASLQGLGRLHFFHGDEQTSLDAFTRSYQLRIGPASDLHGAAQALIGIGRIALRRGDLATAREHAVQSHQLMSTIGDATGLRLAQELIALCG